MIHRQSQSSADIVIVGNGIAGLTAAIEARRFAPDLRIAIITEQSNPTINTPALKQFAMGKLERQQLLAYPVGTERAQRIQLLQARVVEIDAQGNFVRLANGSAINYGSLLLATGSAAVGLPTHLPGRDFDGVMTLHRLHDYINLRRRLYEVEDVVVIGGGAHAIETVTSLLYLGIRTHWLIRGKTCLSRILDQRSSELVMRHIQQAGARIYTETEIVGIAGNTGTVVGVVTNHQQMLPCQLVLACTGMKPVTTLAEHCTLPIMFERDQGIFVNNQLRTNVPGIYAAGDVASLHNPQTGNHEIRAQWYSAVVQGCTAAAAMTGQLAAAQQPFDVHWHATRLGALSLLTVGSPLARTTGSVTLTDSYKRMYRRLSIFDDRLIGYLSLGQAGQAQADGLAIKRLIDEGHSIAPLKDALLKGTFDARTYFSQRHSIAVFDMAISGKIPVVRTTQRALPPVRSTLLERVSLSSLEKERAQADRPLSIVGSAASAASVASVPITPLPRPSAGVQFRVIHSPTERR
ncbi:MAG: NAD(P)/FAD-dependent oxidoreductase [Chloroflexi bacterium]|nr:MAG: NAD(P)/FAD-dependent oxidoreductase [Chloroflexota bacterium]